ncbi:esterase family protein [Flavobacteriaceae bacterium]|nr:esterase family protein [Flavobacteriaceae bacterium]MDA9326683.1 esterase family protein [Flavobacteriaceae bacterium]MDA9833055.1 esterase family protein [Flavobacteriaceae bacterium]MDB4160133.1 esterase family protein [Flavobacteriaceae bacterium]MDB4266575.1 esterase family protein [Flavobacteriaceae bacterium]
MKNTIYLLTLFMVFTSTMGQYGKVMDHLTLDSKILKGERNFAVYLPPDYDHSSRSYPVLYLLHGYTDDHTGWVQFGEVLHIADKAINDGSATAMIIIMPDADSGLPGYTNAINGKWDYEDFFFNELMPHVEERFRIKKNKRYRAVAGLSMGGGGTFLYAMHRPDLFSSAAPLSASLGPQSLEEMKNFPYVGFSKKEINQKGFDLYSLRNNPLKLVDKMSKKDLNSVRWYIDCGDDDFLYEANSLMHLKMREKEIKHEFRIRDGDHSWDYWRSALPSVLAFISKGFHQ